LPQRRKGAKKSTEGTEALNTFALCLCATSAFAGDSSLRDKLMKFKKFKLSQYRRLAEIARLQNRSL
jgi:hypothetical protein